MSLQEGIAAYLAKGHYPLHMPGHKRRAGDPALPFRLDVTELPETDDLHAPSGILREAMARTAALYGADRTWYLVNGSSCGNLAAIAACCRFSGEAVVARNCHRSVLHALLLRRIRVRWLLPEYDTAAGVFGSVCPSSVEELLCRYPASEAVVLASPSYCGVVSNVRRISEICHRRGIPLIVDEAHGAHFGIGGRGEGTDFTGVLPAFPPSAIQLGADLVVQSPHKTLSALTQAAWLHYRRGFADPDKVSEMLSVFETSSPSYPLLFSLDACTETLSRHGASLFSAWQQRLTRFYEKTRGLRHFSVLCPCMETRPHPFYAFDYGKLVLSCRGSSYSGHALAETLRSRFSFALEMDWPSGCLAMTSPFDDADALDSFAAALLRLDQEEGDRFPPCNGGGQTAGNAQPGQSRYAGQSECVRQRKNAGQRGNARQGRYAEQNMFAEQMFSKLPEQVLPPWEAAEEREQVLVPVREAAGHIMGEYAEAYPPGIPLLVPGERISREWADYLLFLRHSGGNLHFSSHRAGSSQEGEWLIRVLVS